MIFALIWIHLPAAVVWIGGMAFLSVVLVPVLRRDGTFARHAALFRAVAYRFRTVVWAAMGLLVGTGIMIATRRSIALSDPRLWPGIFAAKMALVAFLFALTLLHDLAVGPRVRRILETAVTERTARDRLLVRYSVLVPRLSLLTALFVLLLAVILARSEDGSP